MVSNKVLYVQGGLDTNMQAWYSILDREFPPVEAAYQTWLADANFDEAGQQRQKLADLIATARITG